MAKDKGYVISAKLGRVLSELPENEKRFVQNQVIANIEHWCKDFNRDPEGPNRARRAYDWVDKYIKDWNDETGLVKRITCKRGCSGCCHLFVEITPDEADLLAQLVKDGVWIDRELLKRQAAFEGGPEAWFDQPKEESRCVFLSVDGNCKIYRDRPTACRSHFVMSDPIHCTPEGDGDKMAVVISRLTEAFVSATRNFKYRKLKRNRQNGPLAVMLLKRLGSGK